MICAWHALEVSDEQNTQRNAAICWRGRSSRSPKLIERTDSHFRNCSGLLRIAAKNLHITAGRAASNSRASPELPLPACRRCVVVQNLAEIRSSSELCFDLRLELAADRLDRHAAFFENRRGLLRLFVAEIEYAAQPSRNPGRHGFGVLDGFDHLAANENPRREAANRPIPTGR